MEQYSLSSRARPPHLSGARPSLDGKAVLSPLGGRKQNGGEKQKEWEHLKQEQKKTNTLKLLGKNMFSL